jgi:hypothetical protein
MAKLFETARFVGEGSKEIQVQARRISDNEKAKIARKQRAFYAQQVAQEAEWQAQADRRKELEGLVRDVLPLYLRAPADVQENIRCIARIGGEVYNEAIMSLKFADLSEDHWCHMVDVLGLRARTLTAAA